MPSHAPARNRPDARAVARRRTRRDGRPGARAAVAPLAALVAGALAAGCSGDERAFVEAVEAAELGLDSLAIVAPEALIVASEEMPSPLVLAPGESVDLDLAGGTEGGAEVEVPDGDRDWRTDAEAVGTIDGSGVFTARGDGETAVRVGVGGVDAPAFPVIVSSAPLAEIAEIRGPESPDPCTVARYTAVGAFDDGTRRLLPDVSWSLPEGGDGTATPVLRDLEDGVDGEIGLVARAPGPLVLRATARGDTLDETIQVPDTLASIAIASPGTLRAGDEVDLVATGTFTDPDDDSTRTANLTDGVDFAVDDEELATVSNLDDGTRGQLRALRQGSGTVTASCGAVDSDALSIDVGSGGSGDGSAGGLTIEIDNQDVDLDDDDPFEIPLFGRGTAQSPLDNRYEIRVSTTEGDDDDADVTDRARIVSRDPDTLEVDETVDGTFLRPVGLGSVRVIVDLDDLSESFFVEVVSN